MVVKTKYNPNDIVFFLHESKVKQEKIDGINIYLSRTYAKDPINTIIKYKLGQLEKYEKELHPSLNVLKKNLIINSK